MMIRFLTVLFLLMYYCVLLGLRSTLSPASAGDVPAKLVVAPPIPGTFAVGSFAETAGADVCELELADLPSAGFFGS